jgi:hypothetical protein
VARQTADEAFRFIETLPAPLPQASASGEGEVVLTWFRGRDRLEAIIAPDLLLSWVCRVAGRNHRGRVLDLRSNDTVPIFSARLTDFFG